MRKRTCWKKLSSALTLLDSDVKGIGLDTAAALVLALVDAVSGRTDGRICVCVEIFQQDTIINVRRCIHAKQGNGYY